MPAQVLLNTIQREVTGMEEQVVVQHSSRHISTFPEGQLVEEREYILPNGDRFIVQSPLKGVSVQQGVLCSQQEVILVTQLINTSCHSASK